MLSGFQKLKMMYNTLAKTGKLMVPRKLSSIADPKTVNAVTETVQDMVRKGDVNRVPLESLTDGSWLDIIDNIRR